MVIRGRSYAQKVPGAGERENKTFDSPLEVILHHGDHSMLDILLLCAKALGRVLLFEFGSQLLDDNVGVANFLSVQLDEGEQASLRP